MHQPGTHRQSIRTLVLEWMAVLMVSMGIKKGRNNTTHSTKQHQAALDGRQESLALLGSQWEGNMEGKDLKTDAGKLGKRLYQVRIRGEVPADLQQRVSALHAMSILKGREGHRSSVTKDVPDADEGHLGLDVPC